MRLQDLIGDAKTVLELPPEELAVVMLQQLNHEVQHDYRNRSRTVPYFNYATYCHDEAKHYPGNQDECRYAIAAAWQHLVNTGMVAAEPRHGETGWYFLTPRGLAVKSATDFKKFKQAGLYPKESIHPEIRENTYEEFLRGDYETAVFKAFKCIEVTVRARANLPDSLIGVPLMRRAFDKEKGPLSDMAEQEGEREALAHLFAGAIGRFKNPSSHRAVDYDDPAAVIEAIELASLLLRVVEVRGTEPS